MGKCVWERKSNQSELHHVLPCQSALWYKRSPGTPSNQMEDLKTTHDPVSGAITTIEWIEGPTKTRQGGLNQRSRMVTQKLLRTGGPRCPVAAYELLVSKRPPELKQHGRLYLAPLKERVVKSTGMVFKISSWCALY